MASSPQWAGRVLSEPSELRAFMTQTEDMLSDQITAGSPMDLHGW
jgi:hypothetical protein